MSKLLRITHIFFARGLIDNFGLQLAEDEQFFREWQDDLPEITELEKQLLDRLKAGFINLLTYPPLLENVVKLSVVGPLLFIAGFYLSPFQVKAEKSIQIQDEDDGVIIEGRLDILLLKDQFWVMVIESKKLSFSVVLLCKGWRKLRRLNFQYS